MDPFPPVPTERSNIPGTSPTHVETDWFCRRATYWSRVFRGEGIRSLRFNEDKEVGIRFHAAMAAFHRTGSVEDALDAVRRLPCLTELWQTWLEVSIYAWCKRVWPLMSKRYRIVSVEERNVFDRMGVRYKCFTDLILEDLRDHTYWIYDFKTFKWWDQKRYTRYIQLAIGVAAAEDRYSVDNIVIAGSIIQGVSKGTVRGNNLYHPLVYGYRNEDTKAGASAKAPEGATARAAYAYRWKRGFERFDVHGFPDGWRAWVDGAPDEIIADCFPQTAPVFVNRRELDDFFTQRMPREMEIYVMQTADDTMREDPMQLAALFPQTLSACESDRHRCDFFEACHVPTVTRDPVASGLYELRFHRKEPTNEIPLERGESGT